jgi:RHS repeat-associated protein
MVTIAINATIPTSPVHTGTYSLKSTHNAAWGGMYLHHAGVNTATSTHLAFSVRVPDAGAYIQMESYGPTGNLLANVELNSYIPGGSLAANTWYDVAIPLADLSATSTTLTGIVAMRSTTGTVYWDDMQLIAAGGGTGSTTVRYVHTDHLTGSNVVTDSSGVLVETLDYYPYGSIRLDTKVGNYAGERRKFAGTEYDTSTGLNQMGARYYSGGKGRFLSEDPVFLSVGSPELKQKTGLEFVQYLSNPQQFNSYSYTFNNPLKHIDNDGNFGRAIAGGIIGSVGQVMTQYILDVNANQRDGRVGMSAMYSRTSLADYGKNLVEGFTTGATLARDPFVAGFAAGGTSLLVDYTTSGTVDPVKATKAAGTAFVANAIFSPFKVPSLNTAGSQAQPFLAEQHVVNMSLNVAVPNQVFSNPYNATLNSIAITLSVIRAQVEQIQRDMKTIRGVDDVKNNAA